MITLKDKEEIQKREQLWFPVEEKRATAPSKKRSQQAPPSPRQWSTALFYILGIAMPLFAGTLVGWSWGAGKIIDTEWGLNAVVLSMGGSVAVGIVLLYFAFRTWWVALLATVAWFVGAFWNPVPNPLNVGAWLVDQQQFWSTHIQVISYVFEPLLLSMVIGFLVATALDALVKLRTSR